MMNLRDSEKVTPDKILMEKNYEGNEEAKVRECLEFHNRKMEG
jgi:hypothetical protein